MPSTLPLFIAFALPLVSAVQPVLAQDEYAVDVRLLEALDWYTGVAGYVDDARARTLLLEADRADDALARMWIARVHSRGRMQFPTNRALAESVADDILPEVRRLAEGGVLEAVFLMGTAYDEGLGVAEDPVQAAAWHRRAAESGHVLGQHNIGNQYAAGRGVPQDLAEAVRWWTPAAEAGDAIVQLRMGEAFEAGRGVKADIRAALEWYRAAAARGNVTARAAVQRLEGSE